MKWLAIVLVLANVGFFGWRYERQLRSAHTLPSALVPLPANTPGLRLLSELDELPPLRAAAAGPGAASASNAALSAAGVPSLTPPEPAVVVAPAVESPPPSAALATPRIQPDLAAPEPPTIYARPVAGGGVASDHCVEMGPFPATKDADAIEHWLISRATAVQRIVQVVRKRKFFWVYLAPKNAEEAKAEVADLERKGVRHYRLVQRDGLQHAISLGLFSNQEAVNRRLSEMSQQGFQALVVPHLEVTAYEWLRANLALGYADPDALPRDQLAGAAVQTIDCAKIADLALSP